MPHLNLIRMRWGMGDSPVEIDVCAAAPLGGGRSWGGPRRANFQT